MTLICKLPGFNYLLIKVDKCASYFTVINFITCIKLVVVFKYVMN